MQAAVGAGYRGAVEAKANANTAPAEFYGRAALQAAAEAGHEEIVKRLLMAGADVNAVPAEWYGRTALQATAETGHGGAVVLLLGSRRRR